MQTGFKIKYSMAAASGKGPENDIDIMHTFV